MRRVLAVLTVLLSTCIAPLALSAVSSSAEAGTPIIGRVENAQARAAADVFVRGTVINSKTGNPVRGVRVTVRPQGATKIDGADVTNAEGVFRIDGITCEDDCMLRINGSAKDYETGFRACDATVVAKWANACASPLGRIGRVLLDRL
jgi:hypothetical protein